MPARFTDDAIEVQLQGGLGNQLFGWACGYSLSKRIDSKLVLDISRLTQHGFQLGGLAHGGEVITSNPSDKRNLIRFKKQKVFSETGFHYDPKIQFVNRPVRLQGYFQSWKYFNVDAVDIRRIIHNYELISKKAQDISELMEGANFNVVHIRRGDYKQLQNYHGLTTIDYYKRAERIVSDLSNNSRYIVFTDEKKLAQEIWPNADYYLSPSDISEPFDNLILMSKFCNFIGSNSSFSWWAAYINQLEGIKVFPRPWFATTLHDTRDLLEPNWITIGID